jgi:hypothetical protein
MCTDALPVTTTPSLALGTIPVLVTPSGPLHTISGTQIEHTNSEVHLMSLYDNITSNYSREFIEYG